MLKMNEVKDKYANVKALLAPTDGSKHEQQQFAFASIALELLQDIHLKITKISEM